MVQPSSKTAAQNSSAPAPPARKPTQPRSRPTSRMGVVFAEAAYLGRSTWQGLHRGQVAKAQPSPAAPSFRQDFAMLWRDPDYRSQASGRWMTHVGQGLGSGVQTSLLSMTTSLTAAQGLLINSCINAAELGVHQLAGVWRGLFSDDARNGIHTGAGSAGTPKLMRHQLVSRLLLAGIYEVGIAACLLGILACRGARLLRGKRILLALAAIRVARIFCQATQWASFDGLKGQISDPVALKVAKKRWDSTKAVETGIGLALNQSAAITCQLLPYMVACPSLVGAMACMMGAGLVISLTAKFRLRHYLDEGKNVPSLPAGSTSAVAETKAPPAGREATLSAVDAEKRTAFPALNAEKTSLPFVEAEQGAALAATDLNQETEAEAEAVLAAASVKQEAAASRAA